MGLKGSLWQKAKLEMLAFRIYQSDKFSIYKLVW